MRENMILTTTHRIDSVGIDEQFEAFTSLVETIGTMMFIVFIVLLVTAAAIKMTAGDDGISNDYHNDKMILVKGFNALHRCKLCDKLSRDYQVQLIEAADGEKKCPHCLAAYTNLRTVLKAHQFNWMNHHPDCLLLEPKDAMMIKDRIELIAKSRADDLEVKEFLKYNELTTDMSWVENLNKSMKSKNEL